MSSILTDVKKVLGLDPMYTAFDPDVIMHINSAFANLTQIGVGNAIGFYISDAHTDWDSYPVTYIPVLSLVKQYVYLKVRRTFDPPSSTNVMQSIDNQIKELEWRLNVAVDSGGDNDE